MKNSTTNEYIESENVNWSLQTYFNGKRAKKKLKIEIKKSGTYEIVFINSSLINLKKSNLKPFFLLSKVIQIENNLIEVLFKKKK